MKHTKEPWEVHRFTNDFYITTSGPTIGDISEIIEVRRPRKCSYVEFHKNLDHIIACVNYCAGINPEAIPKMVKDLSKLRQEKAELLEAMANIFIIAGNKNASDSALLSAIGKEAMTAIAKARP